MFKKLLISLLLAFVFIINIVLFTAFFLVQKIYIQQTKKDILAQTNTIKTFLSLQNKGLLSLPILKLTSTQKGLVISINKANYIPHSTLREIKNNYLIYQTYYKNYLITVIKDISELQNIKNAFIQAGFIVNLLGFILSFILAFLISKNSLKTINYLQKYFQNYDFKHPKKITIIPKEKELQQLIKQINKFVDMYQKILSNQKEFIQDVSHQLKTPLMQIYSTLELIENKIDKTLQPKLKQIKESLENLKQVIGDLNFVFNENNFSQSTPTNLKTIIEKVISKYSSILETKKIKLLLQLDNVTKLINPNLFEKLIDNLLSNAIFYNKENGEIYILLDENKLVIQDSGIGISEKDLENIFDRFYRGEESKQKYPNGSGLGLNIVKKIVDTFGWNIKASSKKGIGSKFEIVFNKNLT